MATFTGTLTGRNINVTSSDASATDRITPDQIASLSTAITADTDTKILTLGEVEGNNSPRIFVQTSYDDTGWTYDFLFNPGVNNSGGFIEANGSNCDWISGRNINGDDVGGFTVNTGHCASSNGGVDVYDGNPLVDWRGCTINFLAGNSGANRVDTGTVASGSYIRMAFNSGPAIGNYAASGVGAFIRFGHVVNATREIHIEMNSVYIRTQGSFNGFTSLKQSGDEGMNLLWRTRAFNQIGNANLTIPDYAPSLPTALNTDAFASGVYGFGEFTIASNGDLYQKSSAGLTDLSTDPASDSTNWTIRSARTGWFNAGGGDSTYTFSNPAFDLTLMAAGGSSNTVTFNFPFTVSTTLSSIRPSGALLDSQEVRLFAGTPGNQTDSDSNPAVAALTRTVAPNNNPTVLYTDLDTGETDFGEVLIRQNKYGSRNSQDYDLVGYVNGVLQSGASTNEQFHSTVELNTIMYSKYRLGDEIIFQQPYTYSFARDGLDEEITQTNVADANLSTTILTARDSDNTFGNNVITVAGLDFTPDSKQIQIYVKKQSNGETLRVTTSSITRSGETLTFGNLVDNLVIQVLNVGDILSVRLGDFPILVDTLDSLYDLVYENQFNARVNHLLTSDGTELSTIAEVNSLTFDDGITNVAYNSATGILSVPCASNTVISRGDKFTSLAVANATDFVDLDENQIDFDLTGADYRNPHLRPNANYDALTDFSLKGQVASGIATIDLRNDIPSGSSHYLVFHPDYDVPSGTSLIIDARNFTGGGTLVIANRPADNVTILDTGVNVVILTTIDVTGPEAGARTSIYSGTGDNRTLVASSILANPSFDNISFSAIADGTALRVVSSQVGKISDVADVTVAAGANAVTITMADDALSDTSAPLPGGGTDPVAFIDQTDTSVTNGVLGVAIIGTDTNAASSFASNRIIGALRGLEVYNSGLAVYENTDDRIDLFRFPALDETIIDTSRMRILTGNTTVQQQITSVTAESDNTDPVAGAPIALTAVPVTISPNPNGLSETALVINQANQTEEINTHTTGATEPLL